MATKTTEATDAPAAVIDAPPAAPVETPTRSRRGLKLAAVIAGAVVAAGLLFGGGVLLGVNLPDGRPGFSQGDFPGGQPPQGGFPGGQPPQQQQDTDDN